MSDEGRSLGMAMAEHNANVKRCEMLSYDFQVAGDNLDELATEASRIAHEFYGELDWRLARMHVSKSEKFYIADVYTEVRGG